MWRRLRQVFGAARLRRRRVRTQSGSRLRATSGGASAESVATGLRPPDFEGMCMSGYRDWLAPAPNPEPPLDSHRRAEVARDPAPARALPCRTRPHAVSGRSSAGIRAATRRSHAFAAPAGDETRSVAHRFAESAVRIVLEVLDRRRPVPQLAVVADATVVAAVRTLIGGDLVPGRAIGVAVPIRVRVVLVDDKTAEVFATYGRGVRRFALAARIARTRSAGWRVTALRIR
ncbi:Rv3235 family protein [Nocardia niwae]